MQYLSSPANGGFDDPTLLALLYAEAVTLHSTEVSPDLYGRLESIFSEEEIVELTALIGLTNYFNRFNNALEVEPTQY